MSKLTMSILMGSSALIAGVAGMGGAANAAISHIYGGGSSLVAPYFRQAGDCYGVPQPLVFKGTPPTTQNVAPFNYTGKVPFNCATTHKVNDRAINYISTGSGTGIGAVYSHNPQLYGDVDPTTTGDQFYPSVQYGLSDDSLGTTEVAAYNNGGTVKGVTVVAPGQTPGAGQYANPREKYGRLVQFPISVDPVVIAYDPVYRKVRNKNGSISTYSFNVQNARADGSGGLKLSVDTFCKIFNGQITNWNDPALTAANGGVSLKNPNDKATGFSVPLQIVGRFESSGTTSIFTRHVAAACASKTGNQYADAASTLPSNLQGAHYLKANPNTPTSGETVGKFTLADGSDGVAKYLDFTSVPATKNGSVIQQGRMGYIGPDYTLPAVNNTQTNMYNLQTATLQNSSGAYVAPSGTAALASFGNLLPPQSDASGQYKAGGRGDRANPADWVEPASKTSPLANPTAATGYPIVGTTNFIGYQCFANSTTTNTISGFFNFYTTDKVVSDPKKGLLAAAGLAPLPLAYNIAIRNTFVRDGISRNLDFQTAHSGDCAAKSIVGG